MVGLNLSQLAPIFLIRYPVSFLSLLLSFIFPFLSLSVTKYLLPRLFRVSMNQFLEVDVFQFLLITKVFPLILLWISANQFLEVDMFQLVPIIKVFLLLLSYLVSVEMLILYLQMLITCLFCISGVILLILLLSPYLFVKVLKVPNLLRSIKNRHHPF